MKRRYLYLLLPCAVAVSLGAVLGHAMLRRAPVIGAHAFVRRPPRIRPDYTDTVIPPNIAPLNFCVEEEGRRYVVKIRSEKGEGISVHSRTGEIAIPLRPWRRLLEANRGRELLFDVYVQAPDAHWDRFDTITNTIAREEIDGYLTYRLINAAYNTYVGMGIYQRDLQNHDESVILDNRSIAEGCMNCHTFLKNTPDTMVMHMRSWAEGYESGMLLIDKGVLSKVDTRTQRSLGMAAYTSWHPSGRLVAFSMNKVRQFFHAARAEVRDTVDMDSDLAVYLLDSQSVKSTGSIASPDLLETWPAWSADGRHLYFCSAPVLWSDRDKVPPERYNEVRYDLMRIGYDVDSGAWGEPETILSAAETGLSISQPRVSPDGRFVLFCMSEYGTFPIHLAGTDLYLLDLKTGQHRRLACNSDESDSWH
ncbi:MAG: PD40 domain-containing protein, partial [Candidatus Brocadiae bacterium]|nr:PD40 domain-containing protein [Candidatus Brocadiia bacterium]